MKVSQLTKNPHILSALKELYLKYTKLFVNKNVYFLYLKKSAT